jgi:type I restriction enzyme, S subunit
VIDELSPYPSYEDSGLLWLGRIPSHWSVRRLRSVTDLFVSNIDKHSVDGEVPVRLCNYMDVYKNDRILADMPFMQATAKPEEVERFRLRIGDVLMTKDSESWKDIAVPALVEAEADDLVCGYHLAMLRPNREILAGSYLYQCLRSEPVAWQFRVAANGVTRHGLSHGAIKDALIPIPPPEEQAAIVQFLDHVDRRVRRYVRTKRRLIALLNEQKQALVHQAVTRGLDPEVPLRPSGIDWHGQVPEHWNVIALKHVLSGLIDCEHKTAPAVDDSEFRVVRTTAIRDGQLNWEGTYCTTASAFNEWTQRGVPEPGDVIFTREAPAGEACIVPPDHPVCLGQRTVLMKVRRDEYDPRFLVHLIYSGPPSERIRLLTQGSTVGHFNMDDIGWMPVFKPPIEEQRAIAHLLATRSEAVNEARRTAEAQIDLIREYRTRLIADVVSGKLDVRDAAARLPDEGDEPLEGDDDLLDADNLAEDAELVADPEEVEA